MNNTFYGEFDFARVNKSQRGEDYRTPFQVDRDRIIHSSEFRRLQGKTQVFLPGEFDYYRTRLTHSIEVAQVGRSICNYLFHKEKDFFNNEYHIDSDLVEAACLAHDLGHPPFGHAGERTLNRLMRDYGGFEGNAQTLRLITETFYRLDDHRRGMKPTRAFLDSVLKYKANYSMFTNPLNHFIYDNQKEQIDFVFDGKEYLSVLKTPEEMNGFRSIECQIMDWADDTAYAINDIVDSISGGFITVFKLLKWIEENPNLGEKELEHAKQIIDWIKEGNFSLKFGGLIGKFIASVSIEERETFMDGKTNRYKYRLVIDPEAIEQIELYKRIAVDLVFRSTQIHQMEYKGDMMLERMFRSFEDNYIKNVKPVKLLPAFTDKLLRKEKDEMTRASIVCDYLSGMTDSFAIKTYKRLFDPEFSIQMDYSA
jgi:dGTPase